MAKRKSVALLAPPAHDEIGEISKQYAQACHNIKALEAKQDTDINKIKASYQPQFSAQIAEANRLFERIKQYSEANKDEATVFNGKKSVDLQYVRFGYRTTNPTIVALKGVKMEDIIARLKAKNLMQYLHEKHTLNKELLASDREKEGIDKVYAEIGVEVVQPESFFIEVNETKIM